MHYKGLKADKKPLIYFNLLFTFPVFGTVLWWRLSKIKNMVDNHLIQRDRNRTYSVSNRGTQLIVCNSCDNSLNAYGISV
jgi:hypothetical protein